MGLSGANLALSPETKLDSRSQTFLLIEILKEGIQENEQKAPSVLCTDFLKKLRGGFNLMPPPRLLSSSIKQVAGVSGTQRPSVVTFL
jgi:hypothetical protein